MEVEYTTQPPTSNTGMPTPTSLVSFKNDSCLPGGLAASIAPADMLNVWNATKLNSKGGTVNTADGKCSIIDWLLLNLILFKNMVNTLRQRMKVEYGPFLGLDCVGKLSTKTLYFPNPYFLTYIF